MAYCQDAELTSRVSVSLTSRVVVYPLFDRSLSTLIKRRTPFVRTCGSIPWLVEKLVDSPILDRPP